MSIAQLFLPELPEVWKFNLTSPCLSISNGWNFRKFKGDFLIGKPQKGKIE
jgi:hypothetical protein